MWTDEECIKEAEDFLRQYVRLTRIPRAQAIQCATISDAGRLVQRGFELLGRKKR